MKRWRVRIFVFLLLLGGSAIVNVAVAWACTANLQRRHHQLPQINSAWIASTPDDWPLMYSGCAMQESDGAVKFNAWAYDGETVRFRQKGILAGYPMKSMIARINHLQEGSPPALRQVRSSWIDEGITVQGWGLLPSRPLWPGFAINTVFYASVLWLLFAGPFVVRRWRRIRRGLCPKCAYDLRGSADTEKCPECGSIVAS